MQTAVSLGVIHTPPCTDHAALLAMLKMDHLCLFRFQLDVLKRSDSGTFLLDEETSGMPREEFRNRQAFDKALLEDVRARTLSLPLLNFPPYSSTLSP